MTFIFSIFDPKDSFWGHIRSKKNQNCLLKLKFGTYNHFYNILRLFDVLPNFHFITSWAIITYKHGVSDFPHQLPNNFRR